MSMTLKTKEIQAKFDNLLFNESFDDKAELEAKMIMAQFLSEIEQILNDRQIKRKDLAKMIGTSASFITQLYRGNKIINLTTIAKIKLALKLTCDIKIRTQADNLDSFDKLIGDYLKQLIKQNDDRYSCIYGVSENNHYNGKFTLTSKQSLAS